MKTTSFTPIVVVVTLALLAAEIATGSTAESRSPVSGQEQLIHEHLQKLGEDLRGRMWLLEHLAGLERRRDLSLKGGAAHFRRKLDFMEVEVRKLETELAPALLEKIRSLQRTLANLERAEELMTTDPDALLPFRDPFRKPPRPAAPQMTFKGIPANDRCVNAMPIGPGTIVGDTSEATSDGTVSTDCAYSSSPDVWFKFSPEEDGQVFANTWGSDYDTVLSIHSSCPGTVDNQVRCRDDSFDLQAGLTFEAEKGVDYFIRVGGWADSAGLLLLTIGSSRVITGTVRDSATGEPIPDLRIDLLSPAGFYTGGHTRTDSSGNYALGNLWPGKYFLKAGQSSVYVSEVYPDLACPGTAASACDLTSATPLFVTPEAKLSGIDFLLDVGGGIGGRVTDAASGIPLPVTFVTVWESLQSLRSTNADSDGRYRFQGLPAGSYFVTASEFNEFVSEVYDDVQCSHLILDREGVAQCDIAAATPIEVALGSETSSIDFALNRGASITGRVTDEETGDPIGYTETNVYDANGNWISVGFGDSSGDYAAGGLPEGNYYAGVRLRSHYSQFFDDIPWPCFDPDEVCEPPAEATPIQVDRESMTSGIDFALQRRGWISGRLTDATNGEAIWGMVEIWDSSGQIVRESAADSSGHYTSGGLQEGTYFVSVRSFYHLGELYKNFRCPGGGWEGCDPTAGTPVEVGPISMTAGIDFQLVPLGSMAGKVSAAASGQPLADVYVNLWGTDGSELAWAVTDSGGQYSVMPQQPGTCFASTAAPLFDDSPLWKKGSYQDELYDNIPCPFGAPFGCDPRTGTPIEIVVDSTTSGIDFYLEPAGTISGCVWETDTGVPIDSFDVNLWNSAGTRVSGAFDSGCYSTTLAPGTYFVTIEHTSYVDEVYPDTACVYESCDFTGGTPIVADLGSTITGIDFFLDPGGAIAGKLVDGATGDRLQAEVEVEIWDADATFVTSIPSSSGGYGLVGLPQGSYFATVKAGSGYLDQLHDDLPCPGGGFVGCDPTTGTPITVLRGQTTSGIDFVLEREISGSAGTIAGRITDAVTGEEIISSVRVDLWDENSARVWRATPDSSGQYSARLPAGTYYATTVSFGPYQDELYDDLPCPYHSPSGCDPTSGTPIVVTAGQVTSGIDFALAPHGAPSCIPTPTALCLADDRFRVEVDWKDHQANAGAGQAVELTGDTGYFWFFSPDNVEAVLKVLDACYEPFNRFWVFAAGLTDVECALTVTDTWTGEVRTWANPLGVPFEPIQETAAFATCDAVPPSAVSEELERLLAELDQRPVNIRQEIPDFMPWAFAGKGECLPADSTLCLNQGRFQVEVFWQTPAGETGDGQAVPLTADTGYFWFFGPDNVEVVVKVLDACFDPFDRFWVFAAGLTDVEVTLRLTDTDSGDIREYRNPMGTAFAPIQDTDAFATCP